MATQISDDPVTRETWPLPWVPSASSTVTGSKCSHLPITRFDLSLP
jgi:hypothetical protein